MTASDPSEHPRISARQRFAALAGDLGLSGRPDAFDRAAAWFFGSFACGLTAYSAIRLWLPGLLVGTLLILVFGTRAAGAIEVDAEANSSGVKAKTGYVPASSAGTSAGTEVEPPGSPSPFWIPPKQEDPD